ncbi:MAG TPA: Jag N-terminal domain-containing protein [Candidatus Cloacimonadota bacterium]|nr:Jag N-terminal domain-containing protein [Candidatus Cloacimonadota bacterium]
MTTIDKSGSDVEEIIRQFRREHNIRDHELSYEILKKPSKGIFGLFANKIALVRFNLPETSDRAQLYTETLLKKMGVSFDGIKPKMEGKTLYLSIEGVKDPGFVIGKNGLMLETLQYLVNRVFEDERKLDRIYLDADGYRERREAQFLRQFLPLIAKIKSQGKPLTLDPMSPGERRIIHRHIERDRGLRTLTIGEGENKRIVIFSAKQKESDVLAQNQASAAEPKAKKPAAPKKEPKPQKQERPIKTAVPPQHPEQHEDVTQPRRKPRQYRKPGPKRVPNQAGEKDKS